MAPTRRRRRLLRWGILGVLATALAAVLAAGAFVHTDAGRAWLARSAATWLSGPGRTVSLMGLEGSVLGSFRIGRIAVGDDAGRWLEVRAAAVSWRPWALLGGSLDIVSLDVAELALARLPAADTAAPEAPSGPAWPLLPVDVGLERLSITRVRLGEPVLGAPAAFAVEGEAVARGAESLRLALDLRRTDGQTGHAGVQALFRPADRRLALHVAVDEPAGGLLARLMDLPGLPPVRLSLDGEGPLDDWLGRLSATAGDLGRTQATLTLRRDGALTLVVDGTADVAAPGPPLDALLAGGIAYDVETALEEGGVLHFRRARVTTAAVAMEFAGRLDTADLAIDAEVWANLTDPRAVNEAVAPAEVHSLAAAARLTGPVFEPEVRLDITLDRLAAPGVEARGLTARAEVAPEARPGQPGLGWRFEADGGIERVDSGDPLIARLAGDGLAWQAAGRLDTGEGTLDLADVALSAADARATGSLSLGLTSGAGEAAVRLALGDLAVLAPVLGAGFGGRAELDAYLRGRAEGDDYTLDAMMAGTLTSLSTGEPVIDSLFGGTTGLSADLTFSGAGGLELEQAVLDGPGARLESGGTLAAGFETLDLDYALDLHDLGRLSPPTGADLAGRGRVSGRIEGPVADPRLEAAFAFDDARIEGLDLGRLAGGLAVHDLAAGPRGRFRMTAAPPAAPGEITGRGDFAVSGRDLRLSGLELAAADGRAEGALTVPLDGRPLSGGLTARFADLAPWAALAGLEARGAVSAELDLGAEDGRQVATLDATAREVAVTPDPAAGPVRAGTVTLALRASDLLGAPRTEGSLTVRDAAYAGAKAAEIAIQGRGGLEAADLDITLTSGRYGAARFDAAGRANVGADGVRATLARLDGAVSGRPLELRREAEIVVTGEAVEVSGLALRLGAGAIEADGRLGPERLAAELSARALDLALLETVRPGIGLSGTLDARARLEGPLDAPTGEARLTVTAARLAGRGPWPALDARLETDWRDGRARLTGDVAAEAGGELRFTADLPVTLARDPVELSIPPRERITASVDSDGLPLSLLQPLWPDRPLGGTGALRVRLDGTLAEPAATADVTVEQARVGAEGEWPAFDASLSGEWRGGRLRASGAVSGVTPRDVELAAEVPLRLSPRTLALELPEDEPVSGRLAWRGEIGPVFALLPLPEHRLSGQADINLEGSGTMGAPQITGAVALTAGRYENLVSGTLLGDLDLRLKADGRRVVLSSLTATDGEGGKIRGTGSLELSSEAGFPFSADIAIREATLVRRDEITAAGSGRIAVSGSRDGALVSGSVETSLVEARIPENLPPEVVTLDVVEVGGGPGAAGGAGTAGAPEVAPYEVRLDLEISMPRRLFVRGRGLDSEWAGSLSVTGTVDEPVIDGRLGVVRGEMTFIGKTFTVKSGTVRFRGDAGGDPVLDVEAVHTAPDLAVTAEITGPASGVSIALRSSPSLPQDEIVSRLLFGKSAGQLSAVEAVQLAGAVAELTGASGGTGGVLDFARRFIGADVLRVEAGAEGKGARLKAGKYVGENVFVGVEQGTQPNTGEVTVEVEVTPNISVESDVGQSGGSSVGAKVKWDY